MAANLKGNVAIWKLARDLGLRPKDDPFTAILSHCVKRVQSFIKEIPCKRLSELLNVATAKLDTIIVEIRSDAELQQIRREYLARAELEFADLERQLHAKVYAITFRLQAPRRGDRQFVSIIDCRGDKVWRSYFSKWHELAHLLTLTSQMRLKYCRTHVSIDEKDPEELAMDLIAGKIGYDPRLLGIRSNGKISFDKINAVRKEFCPEASFVSSVIGFVKTWPTPCILVEAGLGYKKSIERRLTQGAFDFVAKPVPELRAVHANPNEAARQYGITMHRNMRVPEKSVIHSVFSGGSPEATAIENLNWWRTSDGEVLKDQRVAVEAIKNGDRVFALIVPIE